MHRSSARVQALKARVPVDPRLRGGTHAPEHNFDPKKPDGDYCLFVKHERGVNWYVPLPHRSESGGNGALREFAAAARAGLRNFTSKLSRGNIKLWRAGRDISAF